MSITLFGTAGSTCTSLVLTTLFEKQVQDFVLKNVNLAKGEHKKPEYLKLQPFGVIPVLQDGDLTIFESRAIARYVSDKYEGQGTPLFGKTEKERALVNQWLEVESQNYYPVVSSIAYQLVFGPRRGLKPDEKVVEQQLQKFEKVLDIYEEHLAKNEYLAGNFFSLADLAHIPFTYLLLHQAKKGEGITSRKHVKAWWDKISSRPSWKQLLDLRAQS
ncbi:unnamed protein product [Sphagnum jensenii]|uniref:glutathione transferase n=1 Tax=Sphagnum jensenii TaxID=128206 RepID=A0ABP1C0P3_9BRYO